jgi:hypothetical protein
MKKRIFGLFAFITIITACNNHFMTLPMLQEQLDIQKLNEIARKNIINYGIYEFFKASYQPNGLWEVICIDKKTNKKVALTINKNTTLLVTDKKESKHRLYFDTVYLKDNKIYGLSSRFINKPQEIDFNDIEKIEIHSEMAKSREVN